MLNILKAAKSISDVIEDPTEFQIKNSDILLKKLINGLFYDFDAFDQKVCGKLEFPLLNSNADYLPLKDNLDTVFDTDKFIKPTRDLKAFDAGILKAGDTMANYIKNISRQRFYLEEDIVVAPIRTIWNEYRFFVVDGVVVSGSAYRVNTIPKESMEVPDRFFEKAQEYANMYAPHDIYTLDLAWCDDDSVSIIEYNCFNCSGVYLCDLVKTYEAIKRYKQKRGY